MLPTVGALHSSSYKECSDAQSQVLLLSDMCVYFRWHTTEVECPFLHLYTAEGGHFENIVM